MGGGRLYIGSMLDDLYSGRLLEAAASIPPRGVLEDADAVATRRSRVCGSVVTVSLKVSKGLVGDIGLDVKACALGQASSALLANAIRGASLAELIPLRDQMKAMLKDGGPAPDGARWQALADLAPIRDYPQRHASTLLVFEAVADCVEQIEGEGR